MFKNRKRKIAVALTAAMLLGSVCVGNVSAGSTVSGSMGGYSCYGSVSIGLTSASAYTSYGTISYVYANVSFESVFDKEPVVDTKTEENYARSITAVATKSRGGADPVKATGTHRITNGSYHWYPPTTSISY